MSATERQERLEDGSAPVDDTSLGNAAICDRCGQTAEHHIAALCRLHPTTTAGEPEVGSPAWERRRRMLWDEDARALMAALVKYEDGHPADAICLASALEAARGTVARA